MVYYNLYNLNYAAARVLMRELGEDIFKHIHFNDNGYVDVNIDASLVNLKIIDGFITFDKEGKLFTISPEDYQTLIV